MICKKCLLTHKNINVSFNKNGVCNFCVSYEENKPFIADFPRLKLQFDQRIRLCLDKTHPKYDCIVPLSGGKDSSFILCKLKEEYRLRILAVTCWNGFNTRDSIVSAKSLCRKLNVDQVCYYPPWAALRRLYSHLFKARGDICEGCMALIWVKVFKLALAYKIPAIIIGESRDQMMGGMLYA